VFSCIVASFFRCRNPLSPTFLFLSEGQQPLFSWSVTHHPVSGISASQGTSSAYWPRRLITVIWSHTSARHFLHHHCHLPLLLLSSTPGSKLIFSTNPFLNYVQDLNFTHKLSFLFISIYRA